MPKYNFYDLKGKVLPKDINDPVKKMLSDDLKCKEAIPLLDNFEDHLNCGEIQIFDKKKPRVIRIKTNYGMCEGYDLVKTVETDEFSITALKHIKNHNLSMKNTQKEPKNG